MNDAQIKEALAEHVMGWHEAESRRIPYWHAKDGAVARTVREWDPLNNPADAKMVQDVMIKDYDIVKSYYAESRRWFVTIAESRGLGHWQANDPLEFRAAAIAALRAKGVWDD